MIASEIFKAYDVRGTYPDQINETAVERIAGAYATYLQLAGRTVAVGRDVRLSSPSLQAAVIKGLTTAGVNVVDIGLGPTELIYFAVGSLQLAGGIQVSASHNPAEYNGLKMIAKGVEGISKDNGMPEIQSLTFSDQQFTAPTAGTVEQRDLIDQYLASLDAFADLSNIPALTIVANANFGVTGQLVKKYLHQKGLDQIKLIELNFEPDGSFPKGSPSPQLVENRAEVSALVRQNNADFAVSWDPDGDRCFFADENGEFIQGCHLTALLAEQVLADHPGEKVIFDATNVWAAEETIQRSGGVPIINKVGHTFIKNRMKSEEAIFGGENSGHSYFREFYHADNGIIPFLIFLDLLANKKQPVSAIFTDIREHYPVSGELNFKVKNIDEAVSDIKSRFPDGKIDTTDGLSMSFGSWRFNLRASNTEPLLRLNVEARDADNLMIATNRVCEFLRYHTVQT